MANIAFFRRVDHAKLAFPPGYIVLGAWVTPYKDMQAMSVWCLTPVGVTFNFIREDELQGEMQGDEELLRHYVYALKLAVDSDK